MSPVKRNAARRPTDGIFGPDTGTPLARALDQREAGRIEDAIATLLAASERGIDDADVAITLAKMLAETGQLERAEPWFRHAMKLEPGDLAVRLGYGSFLGETGRIAEARDVLEGVRVAVRELMVEVAPDGVGSSRKARADREALASLTDFLGATEVNLARAALEAGDALGARALAAPWLTHEHNWGFAHAVLADAVERDGLDPGEVAEDGLARGEVSPYMVCYLLERLVEAHPCDLAAVERVVARADRCFAFDWRRAALEVIEVLGRARALYGRAVMRGLAPPGSCPELAGEWSARRVKAPRNGSGRRRAPPRS